MKTGVAIALAIGVPVTIGVIAWAALANRVVDIADKNVTGGGGKDCGELRVDATAVSRLQAAAEDATNGMSGLATSDSALQLAVWVFSSAWPSCPFGDASTTATFVRADGSRITWSQIKASIEGLTIADVAAGRATGLNLNRGMQSSSGDTLADAARMFVLR